MVGPCRWETMPSTLDLISMDFYFVDDGAISRGRESHSSTTLYIPLVILYTK